MSKETRVAVWAAIPPTLAILISLFTLLLVGTKRDKKLDTIHGLVNSRLHEALTEIKTLRAEVKRLKGK